MYYFTRIDTLQLYTALCKHPLQKVCALVGVRTLFSVVPAQSTLCGVTCTHTSISALSRKTGGPFNSCCSSRKYCTQI